MVRILDGELPPVQVPGVPLPLYVGMSLQGPCVLADGEKAARWLLQDPHARRLWILPGPATELTIMPAIAARLIPKES